MQVTETLSDGLKRAFTVVVPAADIESRRTKRLTELGKNLRLPGFRPGKVPMPVVRQRYGTAVTAEVLEESVNEATRQVLSDRGLRAGHAAEGRRGLARGRRKDLEFKVEVELLPEIAMPDFAAIELTRLKAEPDAGDDRQGAGGDRDAPARTGRRRAEPRRRREGRDADGRLSSARSRARRFPAATGTDVVSRSAARASSPASPSSSRASRPARAARSR